MKSPALRLALFLALPMSPQAGQDSKVLGRLFLTPIQRDVLEQQRQTGTPETGIAKRLRLEGMVLRSSGDKWVWINGRIQDGRELPPLLDQSSPSRASPADRPLKVGESINAISGEREHLIPPGSMHLHPPPP
jgi:hypothetical protein